jgi:thiol:disulfide interchange protein DsbA
LFVTLAAFTVGAFAQDAASRAGKKLTPPQPVENDGKIEVLEFFGYGCIHCAHLEPRLHEWVKKQPADVKFVRVPVPAAHRGVPSIPIYYTLEAMGLADKMQQKVFDAIHVENIVLGNPSTLNAWLEKQGVDPKKFEEVQKSFSVQGKIRRAEKMAGDYRIVSTPTLVVNGKYSVEQTAGAESLFANADTLIAGERAANKPAAAPAKAPAKK